MEPYMAKTVFENVLVGSIGFIFALMLARYQDNNSQDRSRAGDIKKEHDNMNLLFEREEETIGKLKNDNERGKRNKELNEARNAYNLRYQQDIDDIERGKHRKKRLFFQLIGGVIVFNIVLFVAILLIFPAVLTGAAGGTQTITLPSGKSIQVPDNSIVILDLSGAAGSPGTGASIAKPIPLDLGLIPLVFILIFTITYSIYSASLHLRQANRP